MLSFFSLFKKGEKKKKKRKKQQQQQNDNKEGRDYVHICLHNI